LFTARSSIWLNSVCRCAIKHSLRQQLSLNAEVVILEVLRAMRRHLKGVSQLTGWIIFFRTVGMHHGSISF
jgi:hypothetical protein